MYRGNSRISKTTKPNKMRKHRNKNKKSEKPYMNTKLKLRSPQTERDE
jgi:hypothetical protein